MRIELEVPDDLAPRFRKALSTLDEVDRDRLSGNWIGIQSKLQWASREMKSLAAQNGGMFAYFPIDWVKDMP